MLDLALNSFITLFVIIDPVGLIPIYQGLAQKAGFRQRGQLAFRGVAIGGGVLLLFAVAGDPLLRALGVSLPAFRAAGGAMLFLIGLEMMFQRRTQRRSRSADPAVAQAMEEPHPEDVSIFPLAMPLIAGPGAITSVMLMMGRAQNDWRAQLVVLSTLVAVLAITYATFAASNRLGRLVGPTLSEVLTRLLGIVLAAVGVEYLVGGLYGAWRAAAANGL
ncbi:MAG: MarC-family rane protein [Rhodospirillales bacterium]|jgi:multiple antibiotic resistance protein|nr:MarC-family rane protein [Rhodospirillales bacterium]